MPKPNQGPQPQERTFNCEITIPTKYLKPLDEAVDTEDPIGSKVASAAEGALLDICEGGLMLNAKAVQKMSEAFGKPPGVDEVVEQFTKGLGRANGKLQFVIEVTPEYEAMLQNAADFQGTTIQECFQNTINYELDQGNLYDPRPFVERVLMRKADYDKLVSKLGKPFTTGTELAGLVEKYLAEHESPFEEVGK